MNRRQAIGIVGVAALPHSMKAAASDQADVMTMLIEDVILQGDVSNLDSIVAENVTIASLGVTDIADFEAVSLEGYEARQSEFTELAMEIVSLAENGEWVHALVNATGELHSGRKQSLYLFYVARLRDGLISHLYFG